MLGVHIKLSIHKAISIQHRYNPIKTAKLSVSVLVLACLLTPRQILILTSERDGRKKAVHTNLRAYGYCDFRCPSQSAPDPSQILHARSRQPGLLYLPNERRNLLVEATCPTDSSILSHVLLLLEAPIYLCQHGVTEAMMTASCMQPYYYSSSYPFRNKPDDSHLPLTVSCVRLSIMREGFQSWRNTASTNTIASAALRTLV